MRRLTLRLRAWWPAAASAGAGDDLVGISTVISAMVFVGIHAFVLDANQRRTTSSKVQGRHDKRGGCTQPAARTLRMGL